MCQVCECRFNYAMDDYPEGHIESERYSGAQPTNSFDKALMNVSLSTGNTRDLREEGKVGESADSFQPRDVINYEGAPVVGVLQT